MTAPGSDLTLREVARHASTVAALSALAAWYGATVVSQHPQTAFDRARQFDRFGLIVPNWRFFAPEPSQHDFHVLHRVLTADDEETPWIQTTEITPRAWTQMFWFPSRRREKALFDLASDLMVVMAQTSAPVTVVPAYWTLADIVAHRVHADYDGQEPPQGFQFLIARHTGYEQEPEPEPLFVSAFVPLAPAGSDMSTAPKAG